MNVTDTENYMILTRRVFGELKRNYNSSYPNFQGSYEDVQDCVWATLMEIEKMLKEMGEI